MTPPPVSARCAIAAGFLISTLVACSAGTADQKSGTFTVSFPSTNAAIATDKLELHVFDGADSNVCLKAVQARQNNQPLPASLFDIPATPTCDFLANGVKAFDLGYGTRAFLVVGLQPDPTAGKEDDFMIGCTLAGVGDVNNQVNVPLTVVSNTSFVPVSTKCASLSDRCKAASSAACY